jgi:fluoride exporter
MMFERLAWLAFAGALGTLARYGLSSAAQRWADTGFPLGTLVVNVTGCLLFGIVWSLAQTRTSLGLQTQFIILTGFMGAFTTFSTFAFETSELLATGHWMMALINLAIQNLLGLGAVFAGSTLGRMF